jgi:hypothetical protein
MDVKVECLSLVIENGAGYEHRIGPIAARAAQLFGQWIDTPAQPSQEERTRRTACGAIPSQLDLARSTDEEAARQIARAWLDAVALQLHT